MSQGVLDVGKIKILYRSRSLSGEQQCVSQHLMTWK